MRSINNDNEDNSTFSTQFRTAYIPKWNNLQKMTKFFTMISATKSFYHAATGRSTIIATNIVFSDFFFIVLNADNTITV